MVLLFSFGAWQDSFAAAGGVQVVFMNTLTESGLLLREQRGRGLTVDTLILRLPVKILYRGVVTGFLGGWGQ